MSEVYTFGIKTGQLCAMIDITSEIQNQVKDSGIKNGICIIFVPHTTAGITINENSDTDLIRYIVMETRKMVSLPVSDQNRGENFAAIINASATGYSLTVIIEEGRLVLGTWQGIYFMEYDGPRIRKVHVKIIEG